MKASAVYEGIAVTVASSAAIALLEKRANLPWKTFRDEVARHFGGEIIAGKIARHVIDDHYKGMWADLVAAAGEAVKEPRSRLAFSRLGKIVPKSKPSDHGMRRER